MQINKFLYFGDFFAIPVLVVAFAVARLCVAGPCGRRRNFCWLLSIGGAAWTLIEYVVHRYIYHHAP